MFRIYRRQFNPPPRDNGTIPPNTKQLVATFTPACQNECESCLTRLQQVSLQFNENLLSQWRYTLEVDPPIPKPASADAQVDLSGATPTKRPIAYELHWREQHGLCVMHAFNRTYGSIRGSVSDSLEGRALFRLRILDVWPNAQLKRQ